LLYIDLILQDDALKIISEFVSNKNLTKIFSKHTYLAGSYVGLYKNQRKGSVSLVEKKSYYSTKAIACHPGAPAYMYIPVLVAHIEQMQNYNLAQWAVISL